LQTPADPDLSVEAVVLSPQFRHLFSAEELAIAKSRMKRFPVRATRRDVEKGSIYPDELPEGRKYKEGAIAKVQVNRYERDPGARAACLKKHGTRCMVCGLKFEERYGEVGEGFIHVHHLKPLATTRQAYLVKPETDLLPVCPNCHAMLHTSDPPLSVDELKADLKSC
jgi:5-methylcytosine-specific restriction protein A